MITHQALIRLFVITLIFLGYGAFTSNTIHHLDDEAAFPSYAFEVPSSVISDDSETGEQPALAGNNPLKINPYLIHLTFSDVAIAATYTSKFKAFKPRAPPTTV